MHFLLRIAARFGYLARMQKLLLFLLGFMFSASSWATADFSALRDYLKNTQSYDLNGVRAHGLQLRGDNCLIEVWSEATSTGAPLARAVVKVLNPSTLEVKTAAFWPAQDFDCAVETGAGVTYHCQGLVCEEAGCVTEKYDLRMTPIFVAVNDQSCFFK
ncbi:MAG: hypothetical protein JST16_01190 [Bdellovibrionales bacterium]|nr:hypothetical protein [Bdellovibrionales bacterium]